MGIPLFGEICALLVALTWAFALVLFKLSGESVSPLSLSLFKNVIGIVLLVVTLPFAGEGGAILRDLNHYDVCILILSGVIGIALADTLLFYSLNIIGVGLLTIMECAYAPSVVLFAWLLLSEQIGAHHYIGGGFILAAIFVSSTHKPPARRTRGELLFGMFLGVAAILLTGFGIVIAKPVLEHMSVISAAIIRLVGGTVVLAMMMAASVKRKALFSVFKPSAAWRICVPASVFGTYFAMIFWIAGFKYTHAAIAAILNQTSTIIALIFASLILKEPFTKRKLTAAILAFSGVVVVAVWSFDG